MQRELKRTHYVNKQARSECAIRARCTNGKFRAVSRLENEAVLDRMQARLAKRPSLRHNKTMDEPGCFPDVWTLT